MTPTMHLWETVELLCPFVHTLSHTVHLPLCPTTHVCLLHTPFTFLCCSSHAHSTTHLPHACHTCTASHHTLPPHLPVPSAAWGCISSLPPPCLPPILYQHQCHPTFSHSRLCALTAA